MDYTHTPLYFRLRKASRYIRLYGVNRTIVKIRGQYHVQKKYDTLPKNHIARGFKANVGLIGCGNYAFSVIAYYLRRNHGGVIRACTDPDISRAASLFERYKASYYTANAEDLISDPKIGLIYIASNHASHAEYAIRALVAGKDVHIEKPHVVNEGQLERLCDAMQAPGAGRVMSVGFNRPYSFIGDRIKKGLWEDEGKLMQSWFVGGHKLESDHWYLQKEEGGRVLGNLCHWTDFTYQMVPPERRFPIRIIPARAVKSDTDFAVTYIFGDGSIASIAFSAKGHAFEGVKERYTAHRGNTLIAMDDFSKLVVDVGAKKFTWMRQRRDHGHERSVVTSYLRSKDKADAGLTVSYVWEAAQLFLKTREALEGSTPTVITEWAPSNPSPVPS